MSQSTSSMCLCCWAVEKFYWSGPFLNFLLQGQLKYHNHPQLILLRTRRSFFIYLVNYSIPRRITYLIFVVIQLNSCCHHYSQVLELSHLMSFDSIFSELTQIQVTFVYLFFLTLFHASYDHIIEAQLSVEYHLTA